MNAKVAEFINNLILYDYILFGATFVLFLLFLILAIILRHKTFLAILLFIISFTILIAAPTVGYVEMYNYLYKNSVNITYNKKLQFTEAIVLKGTLKNESKFDFGSCKISAHAFKVSGNEYKDYILKFKPIVKMSITEHNISKGESRDFKMILEPFRYSKEYNVSVEGDCR
ncbi:MAG: DUF2393 domain-containing protein [Campylobacterales bacterium]|nr:DUF2393 domain-containing protein [Campylobacterales bacterium]